MKLDFEIAVDQQYKTRCYTFDGSQILNYLVHSHLQMDKDGFKGAGGGVFIEILSKLIL